MKSNIMRKLLPALMIFSALSIGAQDESQEAPTLDLNNNLDSMNYFFGLNLGYSMKTAPFQADPSLISRGITEALVGTAIHDQQTCQVIFRELQMALSVEVAKKDRIREGGNIEKGNAFLAQNAEKDGVRITNSGLQYKVITLGDGPMPSDTSTVKVHYEGTLIDGTKFDSSYDRGEPISFPLNRVIPGWTEGVQLMPVGSTYKLFIPSELAYGPRGQGSIPPYSVLIFKIELLGIE